LEFERERNTRWDEGKHIGLGGWECKGKRNTREEGGMKGSTLN